MNYLRFEKNENGENIVSSSNGTINKNYFRKQFVKIQLIVTWD